MGQYGCLLRTLCPQAEAETCYLAVSSFQGCLHPEALAWQTSWAALSYPPLGMKEGKNELNVHLGDPGSCSWQ